MTSESTAEVAPTTVVIRLDKSAFSTTHTILSIFDIEWDDGEPTAKLNKGRLLMWLPREGFHRVAHGSAKVLVKTEGQVVSEFSREDLLSYMQKTVRNLPPMVQPNPGANNIPQECFMDALGVLPGWLDGKLNLTHLLPLLDMGNGVKDTAEATHFIFRNGVVRVTREGPSLLPLSVIDGYIWREDIIDHDIDLDGDKGGQMSKFVEQVTSDILPGHRRGSPRARKNGPRKEAVMSALGYLCNRCKAHKNARAVVFVDLHSEPGRNNGGTGKSLLISAVERLRPTVTIDGKKGMEDSYAWDKVSAATSVVHIDDLSRKLSLEDLYVMVTGNMRIRRPYEAPFMIPFNRSPKIALGINHMPNSDSSTRRRFFAYPASPFYSADFELSDYFGNGFFNEWSVEQWNKFDLFMFRCCTIYHNRGLLRVSDETVKRNGLRHELGEEFCAMCDELFAQDDVYEQWIPTDELFQKFLDFSPDHKQRARDVRSGVNRSKFTRWLKVYCEGLGLKYEYKQVSGGARKWSFFFPSTKAPEQVEEEVKTEVKEEVKTEPKTVPFPVDVLVPFSQRPHHPSAEEIRAALALPQELRDKVLDDPDVDLEWFLWS